MSATLSPSPKQQFFDANGAPLVGGKLYSYTAGTTSPLATYVDSAGTTTNTNPIILDSRGEANVWLGANTYKLALYSATDVLIWTVDDITGAATDTLAVLAASGGSNLIGYLPAGTGAVATTVQTKLRETVSVKDFGAVGDGVTDDTAAIQLATTYGLANNAAVNWPTGIYLCGALTAASGGDLIWYGNGSATIQRIGTDITLINPTGNVNVSGLNFVNYTNGFKFNAVAANKTLSFRQLKVVSCGTTATASGRVDYNAFISCNTISANAIEKLEVLNCSFDGDDFGICYRSQFKSALVDGNSFANMRRMGVMLGDGAGNQIGYQSIRVVNNAFRNIVSDDANEYEVHGVLCFGYRVEVAHNQVDTCYDINASTHDSEAIYVKAVLYNISFNDVVNGGRGDGHISAKGVTLAVEPADIASGTAYNKFGLFEGNKVYASDDFVASYGAISGLLVYGSRVDVKNNTLTGTFDRGIAVNGSSHIFGNHIVGTFSYGILEVVDDDNVADATFSKITDNYVEQTGAGSSGIEFRNSCLTAFTMPVVQIDNNVVRLGAAGAFSGGATAAISVSAYKLNVGNNVITQLQTNNNVVLGRSGSTPNGIVLLGTLGTGTNGGKVTQWNAVGNSGDYISNVYRLDVVAAGDVTTVNVANGLFTNVASRVLSNFTNATAAYVRGIRGQRFSETSGTATIAAGNTSVTVTMNLQDTLRPTSLKCIKVTPTSTDGSATHWWVDTLSADTFVIRVDVAPGGSGMTFAWQADNLYGA